MATSKWLLAFSWSPLALMMLNSYVKQSSVLPVRYRHVFLFSLFVFFTSHPSLASSYQVQRAYRHAESSFRELLEDPARQEVRRHWMECIKEFRFVYIAQPNGPLADDALFMTAHLYAKLYETAGSPEDRREAIDYYQRLLNHFPESEYGSKASQSIAELTPGRRVKVTRKRSEIRGKKSSVRTGPLVEVKGVRYWSSPTYTRVVLNMESKVPYAHKLLKEGAAAEELDRLLIDLGRAHIGDKVSSYVPAEGALLQNARVAPHGPNTVRVVLDMKSVDRFKVFSLQNPFRIVVDVRGVPVKKASKKRYERQRKKPGTTIPKGALAKQLALGVDRIVIDPGHGGRDPGAAGYLKGVLEKNVTLEIGQRLAKRIREQLGCEAILTREGDTYLSLEERTAIANTKNADLFISIHTNAHDKMASHGVETYFLNLATDEDAILLAARENATSAKSISDLEDILSELMKNAKQEESRRLANYVQRAMVNERDPAYGRVKDNGVKEAPFYVLLGAEMPCILIEVAFITNPGECRKLNTAGYQDEIANAIATGIRRYVEDIHPTVTEVGI
jgi:N-acetylmuramoyl-L-alanine amidase